MAVALEASGTNFKGKLLDQRYELERAAQSLRVLAQTLAESLDFTVAGVPSSSHDMGARSNDQEIETTSAHESAKGQSNNSVKSMGLSPRDLTLKQLEYGGRIDEEESVPANDSKAAGHSAASIYTKVPALATKMLKIASSYGMQSGYGASAELALREALRTDALSIALSLDEIACLASTFSFGSTRADRAFTPYG